MKNTTKSGQLHESQDRILQATVPCPHTCNPIHSKARSPEIRVIFRAVSGKESCGFRQVIDAKLIFPGTAWPRPRIKLNYVKVSAIISWRWSTNPADVRFSSLVDWKSTGFRWKFMRFSTQNWWKTKLKAANCMKVKTEYLRPLLHARTHAIRYTTMHGRQKVAQYFVR